RPRRPAADRGRGRGGRRSARRAAGGPAGGGPVSGGGRAPPRATCRAPRAGAGRMTLFGERLQTTLFEKSRPGRGGDKIPHPPKDALDRIPATALRSSPPAPPELNEADV